MILFQSRLGSKHAVGLAFGLKFESDQKTYYF